LDVVPLKMHLKPKNSPDYYRDFWHRRAATPNDSGK
jgi:hypothetical protein